MQFKQDRASLTGLNKNCKLNMHKVVIPVIKCEDAAFILEGNLLILSFNSSMSVVHKQSVILKELSVHALKQMKMESGVFFVYFFIKLELK